MARKKFLCPERPCVFLPCLLRAYRLLPDAYRLSPIALKIALEPGLHAVHDAARAARDLRTPPAADVVLAPEQQQADARRVYRVAYDVHEAAHALRQAEPHRRVEHFLGEIDDAFHLRAAAGQHDARGDVLVEARAAQLLAHQREEFLVTRLDH